MLDFNVVIMEVKSKTTIEAGKLYVVLPLGIPDVQFSSQIFFKFIDVVGISELRLWNEDLQNKDASTLSSSSGLLETTEPFMVLQLGVRDFHQILQTTPGGGCEIGYLHIRSKPGYYFTALDEVIWNNSEKYSLWECVPRLQ